MVNSLFLLPFLICAESAHPPVPPLEPGHELIYKGVYRTGSDPRGAGGTEYRLETRLFALHATREGVDVAVLTVLRPGRAPGGAEGDAPVSIRLEPGRIDPSGLLRLTGPAGGEPPYLLSYAFPEGPPVLEAMVFVGLPDGAPEPGKTWEGMEDGHSPRSWKVAGVENLRGARCLRLEGAQQSFDWERPRPGAVAWQSRDAVWVAPPAGYAVRVERELRLRDTDPAGSPSRVTLTYELERKLFHPGRLGDLLRREIERAWDFERELAELTDDARGPKGRCGALLEKISRHLREYPETPYREVLHDLRRRAEAAQRGDLPPPRHPAVPPTPPRTELRVGEVPGDFVATDPASGSSYRLRRLRGLPVVLLYYQPGSPASRPALLYLDVLLAANPGRLYVLAIADADTAEPVLSERKALGVGIPTVLGAKVHRLHQVRTTPQIAVLDASGEVRRVILGWGAETPGLIRQALAKPRER